MLILYLSEQEASRSSSAHWRLAWFRICSRGCAAYSGSTAGCQNHWHCCSTRLPTKKKNVNKMVYCVEIHQTIYVVLCHIAPPALQFKVNHLFCKVSGEGHTLLDTKTRFGRTSRRLLIVELLSRFFLLLFGEPFKHDYFILIKWKNKYANFYVHTNYSHSYVTKLPFWYSILYTLGLHISQLQTIVYNFIVCYTSKTHIILSKYSTFNWWLLLIYYILIEWMKFLYMKEL